MHEYGVAASLVRMVEERARSEGALRVLRVEIRVGEAAGIEVDLLETAWEGVRDKTLCADAELVVRRTPVQWTCALCRIAIAEDSTPRCPVCDFPAVLEQGDDLHLERFDMERA